MLVGNNCQFVGKVIKGPFKKRKDGVGSLTVSFQVELIDDRENARIVRPFVKCVKGLAVDAADNIRVGQIVYVNATASTYEEEGEMYLKIENGESIEISQEEYNPNNKTHSIMKKNVINTFFFANDIFFFSQALEKMEPEELKRLLTNALKKNK